MDKTALYRIGIDIGGTHTDGVLIDAQANIVSTTKTATTEKLEEGFEIALRNLLKQNPGHSHQITGVYLGTTHATNAILQQTDLYRVGVIRLAGHYPVSLPCGYNWPIELKQRLGLTHINVSGGFECNGLPIAEINTTEVKEAIDKLRELGAESLAIIGVFSPLNGEHEKIVQNIAKDHLGENFPISLSHEIGGIGFIERENSTALNAALKGVMTRGFEKIESILFKLDLSCPLWITQNNGCLISLQQAIAYPILTIAAGPTNSFMGGVKLAGLEDALVIDIGGTSTDIGIVKQGYARRRLNNSQIGGISLNFSMPDVLSIALGGGSYVTSNEGKWLIGPLSCGNRIQQQSVCFGGSRLTLTDVALALGFFNILEADPSRISLSKQECHAIVEESKQRILRLIERMAGSDEAYLPIVVIGGGAALFCGTHKDSIHPPHAHVANAYGAALAEIAGMVDKVVSLQNRDQTIAELQNQAIKNAIAKGADNTNVQIIDQQIIPYHYVPNNMARVVITASGKPS